MAGFTGFFMSAEVVCANYVEINITLASTYGSMRRIPRNGHSYRDLLTLDFSASDFSGIG